MISSDNIYFICTFEFNFEAIETYSLAVFTHSFPAFMCRDSSFYCAIDPSTTLFSWDMAKKFHVNFTPCSCSNKYKFKNYLCLNWELGPSEKIFVLLDINFLKIEKDNKLIYSEFCMVQSFGNNCKTFKHFFGNPCISWKNCGLVVCLMCRLDFILL